MPTIVIAQRHFEVDAVIFDKDGTLVEFGEIWTPRTALWIDQLTSLVNLPGVKLHLSNAVGYDSRRDAIVPDGPIAVASLGDIFAIAASVLFQNGIDWHEGYPLAARVAARTLALPPTPDEILPRGDVAATLRSLQAGGLRLGVATNDERSLTEVALRALEVSDLVSTMVCGDDAFLPKPDPEGLQWLASELGTTPERLAMVGDSGTDMLAGRNAGVAVCIGVTGGAGKHETLARTADVVVDDIGAIRVAARVG